MHELRTVIYLVSDIKKVTSWYEKAFKRKSYFEQSYYMGFNADNHVLRLQPNAAPAENKATSVVAYWGIEDICTSYDTLLNIGAQAYEAPESVGGDIMTARVKDPWGNIIGLIYNPAFKPE